MDYASVRQLFSTATSHGAERLSLSHCRWDLAGNCHSPFHKDIHARPEATHGRDVAIDRRTRTPFWVELDLRCRKCDACREWRRRWWTARAISEYQAAFRTWFGTLTLNLGQHHQCYLEASRIEAEKGNDIDALSYRAQFIRRHSVITREITRYLKRVRKGSSGPLRHLCVTEHHKSGLPHYHMLIHESDPYGTREAVLSDRWTWGFSQWRLVRDPRQATYVCKYLSKSGAARVRASQRYGIDVLEHSGIEWMMNHANPLTRAKNDPNTFAVAYHPPGGETKEGEA